MSYVVNLILKDRRAIVIGGGTVATHKVEDLLTAGAEVNVIAPVVSAPLEEMAVAGSIQVHLRPYAAGDLRGAMVVVAATDDEALNAAVSRDAQSLGILANVVDRPALCTFTMPAVLRRGDLTISVSTEGQCPALASVMREEFENQFGDEYASVVRVMGALRRDLIAQGWSGDRIRGAVGQLYRGGVADMIRTNDRRAFTALWRTVLGDPVAMPPPVR